MGNRTPRIAAATLFALVALTACGGAAEDATTSTIAPVTTAATDRPATTGPAATSAPTTTVAQTSTTVPATTTTTQPTPSGIVIEASVADGVVTGPGRPEVPLGQDVTIIVTSDIADAVHVHGYDLFIDVTPGTAAELTFSADIPGIFEVELETSHALLLELEVR